MADWLAYGSVLTLRTLWDLTSGYTTGRKLKLHKFNENNWLLRLTYLETVAGVPGMMFAMLV